MCFSDGRNPKVLKKEAVKTAKPRKGLGDEKKSPKKKIQ